MATNSVPFELEVFVGFVFGQTMDVCPEHGYTNHIFLGNPENLAGKLEKVCKECKRIKKFFADTNYDLEDIPLDEILNE